MQPSMVVVDQESNEEVRVEERGGEDVRGEDGSGGGATAVEVEDGGREGGLVLRIWLSSDRSEIVRQYSVDWPKREVRNSFLSPIALL